MDDQYTFENKTYKDTYRHTTSHILAQAMKRLYPDVKLAIGPAIEDGFYYDFDSPQPFTPEVLEKLEAEMRKICKEKLRLERFELPREEALKFMEERDEPYKVELINDLPEDAVISFYRQGEFVDLCAGPHLDSTGRVKGNAIKLTSVTGAYWRGDSSRKMLQRIYGTCFPKKEELDAYLARIEEAKKRDHRKLGKELGLFTFMDEGPGFPFFLPNGMVLKNQLIDYWREIHKKAGYVEISTPIMLNQDLWHRSGHWDHYKDNMYTTVIDDVPFALKPMNCPGGMLVYKSQPHSYRDLPLRVGELGIVHRHELSGALHGLFRVRCFTQDDAHIFMTPDQVKDEIKGVAKLIDDVYSLFGFKYHMELSTMPEDHIGTDEQWEVATNGLVSALNELGKPYVINEGDGAFYGPKIDFHLEKAPEHAGDAVLTLENVTLKSERNPNKNILNQVSFSVHKGEILCVAGIEGNGQSELVRVIVGLLKQNSGKILLNGEDVSHASIRYRNVHGLAHVPEDRHKYGLILDNTLEENLAMRKYFRKEFQNHGFIRFHKRRELAEELIEEFDIRSSEGAKSTARSMSGGNQQKAIIAREIDSDENVILAMQPTRGLDVGAIENIHKNLLRQRDAGKAVLLVSFDLEEVMNISDRIIVFYEGEIVADVRPEEVTVNELGLYMSGSKRKGAVK